MHALEFGGGNLCGQPGGTATSVRLFVDCPVCLDLIGDGTDRARHHHAEPGEAE